MTTDILSAVKKILQIGAVIVWTASVFQSKMVTYSTSVNNDTKSLTDIRRVDSRNEMPLYYSPKIELKTKIVTKEELPVDDELRSVKIKLKLIFVNDGAESVLIYKGRASVSHIWISPNEEKALAKEFEASISQTVLYVNEKSVDELTKQDFVILPKGGSYETEEIVTIFVRHDSKNGPQGSISKGDHVLEIYVDTWAWTKEEAVNVQNKFTDCGLLIVSPIRSKPMRFAV